MAYAAWSVVFGEQPTASKWNILGANDASFNDGTGIFGLYKNLLAVDSNPYKFRAYRVTSNQTAASGFVKVQLNGETFDTNSNFDSATNYRYVAPVAGFYLFNGGIQMSTSTNDDYQANLYKNGSIAIYGALQHAATGTTSLRPLVSGIIQLAATDYVELFGYTSNVGGAAYAHGTAQTYLDGILLCRT